MRRTVEHWPPPSTRRWPDAHAGPWKLTLRWDVVQGRIECVGLQLDPAEGADVQPLTAGTLRGLALGRLIAEANEERLTALPDELALGEGLAGVEPRTLVEELTATARDEQAMRSAGRPKPGRPPEYDDGYYEGVAAIYRRAHEQHLNPTQQVARHYHASKSSAARWVSEARARGFLPPTTRGRAASVELTDESGQ